MGNTHKEMLQISTYRLSWWPEYHNIEVTEARDFSDVSIGSPLVWHDRGSGPNFVANDEE